MNLFVSYARRRRNWLAAMAGLALASIAAPALRAQDAESTEAPAEFTSTDSLDAIESRLAERYDRLELLAARLAELSGAAQPHRAELLRQLVTQGRERDVAGQFDTIAAALADESYSTAVDGQAKLQADLEKLLELLLQEDRDRRIESERKRVLRYLQDLNRLIRLERGIAARTEGGDSAPQLAGDQRRVGEEAQTLEQEIDENEATENDDSKDPKPSNETQQGEKSPSEGGEQNDSQAEPQSGEPQEEQQQSGEPQSGEPQEGEKQSGQQQSGQPQPGEQQDSGNAAGDQPQEPNPMQQAAENLRRAQQRMKDAEKRLEEAKRDGALDQQRRALEELEQAKANLERILRQLREEELERMLVLLEARFRKMLDDQVEVYEETKKLDAAKNAPEHEREIAAGRLSRREALIVREADRALVLLREDGTSVAFPEAIEQARDDMQQITDRLRRVKTDMITQGMEEDVIAALEETLAALQQALENLREQQSGQQQGGGAPGEQPLVDQLAELRMIRALQLRVNRRTTQFGAMIEGEQARESELLQLLDELSLRQSKIFQATRDLETGSNQ